MITNTGEAAEEVAEAEAAEPIEYGEFMELKGFMVNPADTNGSKALMVNVGLEGPTTEILEAVTAKEVIIRDRILGKLGKLSRTQLADVTIRDSIKLDLLESINTVLGPDEEERLSRLYFTAFILN